MCNWLKCTYTPCTMDRITTDKLGRILLPRPAHLCVTGKNDHCQFYLVAAGAAIATCGMHRIFMASTYNGGQILTWSTSWQQRVAKRLSLAVGRCTSTSLPLTNDTIASFCFSRRLLHPKLVALESSAASMPRSAYALATCTHTAIWLVCPCSWQATQRVQ